MAAAAKAAGAALALALVLAACAARPAALAPQPDRSLHDPYFLPPGFMGGANHAIGYR